MIAPLEFPPAKPTLMDETGGRSVWPGGFGMMGRAVCAEVGHHSGVHEPVLEFDRAVLSTLDCRHGSPCDPGARLLDFTTRTAMPTAQLQ